jgi:CHASE2 domain-containing sensor protein
LSEAGARTITIDLILAEPDRWNAANIAKELSAVPGLNHSAKEQPTCLRTTQSSPPP